MTHKSSLLLAVLCTVSFNLWSQHPTLNDPSTSSVFTGGPALLKSIENICFIIGAICAVIGGVVTYTEFIDGDEQFTVGVRNWFVSCIAFIVFPFIIRKLTGY
ncbi:DUF4134 family protein [Lewinella sp. IMCC34191]|uniref:DUF4134 family protein n=1 Tax=Lewinella sp. IMCC34191 TaxID=2259172 RepID=UPI000E26CA89